MLHTTPVNKHEQKCLFSSGYFPLNIQNHLWFHTKKYLSVDNMYRWPPFLNLPEFNSFFD